MISGKGCAHRGCAQGVCAQGVRMQGVCMQGVRAQGWWGHSANQITGGDTQPIRLQVRAGGAHTGGVHAGDACAGVVGTLSQSDYTHYSWLIVLDFQSFITICPWLPLVALAIIDLVGDNREFEAFRHILNCYTHYSWLIVLDLESFITICPWLPLVAPSNH